ncbi:hypothetical protein KI387_024353, partial [Taxus chinensis]
NEMMKLKKELQHISNQKEKRNVDDEIDNGNNQIVDIYKKLKSLDNKLGRSKDGNVHNMAIFNAISDFLEQHVHNISMLSESPENISGTDKER